MKKVGAKRAAHAHPDQDTMRNEYDFSKAVRGVTAARYTEGTNVVVLDSDVVRMFPTATAVNEALRAFGGIIRQARKPKRNSA